MKWFLTALTMTSLLTSPAWGSSGEATYASSADRHISQPSVFAGATYRVGLGKRTAEARGRASLTFTGMTRTPTADLKFGQGLQLSAGRTGKPTFFVGGQALGEMQKHKANLSGGTTAVVVIGAIALAAVAAVVIADAVEDERCIGEEGDCD